MKEEKKYNSLSKRFWKNVSVTAVNWNKNLEGGGSMISL